MSEWVGGKEKQIYRVKRMRYSERIAIFNASRYFALIYAVLHVFSLASVDQNRLE